MSGNSLLETFILHRSILSSSHHFSMMGVYLPATTRLAQILLFNINGKSKNQAAGQA